MKIIYKDRGKGKTTDLIKLSAEKDYHIVCMGMNECHRIADQAIDMGLSIAMPITFDHFLTRRLYKAKGFLIDNADMLLSQLGGGKVKAMSITKSSTGESDEHKERSF